MKFPPVLVLLILTLLSTIASAQTRAINFDLNADPAVRAGIARARLAPASSPVKSAVTTALERQVFELLNSVRRKNGLSELTWSDDVAAVARLHSENMAKDHFFSHRGTDGSMVDDRADRVGLGAWRTIGENIAYMHGFENPAEVAVQKWMESTAHRQNLLGPNWKESAVGVAMTDDGTYYMTQVFLLRK